MVKQVVFVGIEEVAVAIDVVGGLLTGYLFCHILVLDLDLFFKIDFDCGSEIFISGDT